MKTIQLLKSNFGFTDAEIQAISHHAWNHLLDVEEILLEAEKAMAFGYEKKFVVASFSQGSYLSIKLRVLCFHRSYSGAIPKLSFSDFDLKEFNQ